MERTEELFRIVKLFEGNNTGENTHRNIEFRPSLCLNLAQRVATNVNSNEILVKKIEKLSKRKEFSNDPTTQMTEISDLFHKKVALIQREFESLKKITEEKQSKVDTTRPGR